MLITIKDILDNPDCGQLQLIAGNNGIFREVSWTSVIGKIDLIRFSNEGYLNFVIGSETPSDDFILALTEEAYRCGMAGMVFAPGGPYIKEVPISVLDFANLHDFPVMTIPWESKIADFTQSIARMIIGEQEKRRSLDSILSSIMQGKESLPLSEEVIKELSSGGWHFNDIYRVMVFQIVKDKIFNQQDNKAVYDKVLDIAGDYAKGRGLTIKLHLGVAIILKGEEAEDLTETNITAISQRLAHLQVKYDGIELRVGIGMTCENITKIFNSYNEALLVTNLISAQAQLSKNIFRYDQMGAYRIIWECRNQKTVENYYKSKLGALKTYDEINKSDLMDFLKRFYKCNNNVRELSQQLFMHKNTVLYKIKKIENILGCDLSKNEDNFNIQLALLIGEIYEGHISGIPSR